MTHYYNPQICQWCDKPFDHWNEAPEKPRCPECSIKQRETDAMTEVRTYLDFREIEMLKDFINKGCGIDTVNLEWTDELHSLLSNLGHIVTAPGFDTEVWKQVHNIKDEPPENIEEMDICDFLTLKNSPLRCPDCGKIHGE